jgi:hypothetical protein
MEWTDFMSKLVNSNWHKLASWSEYIYNVFNDTVSISACIMSNGRVIVNNELERVWKEAVAPQFEVISRNSHGGSEKPRRTWAMISHAEIRTGHIPNTGPNCYRLIQLARSALLVSWIMLVIYLGCSYTRYFSWKYNSCNRDKNN